MNAKTALTEWAWLLFRSLADAGVRSVIVSPGSRNVPFIAGARSEPRLQLFDAMDERSAGFFALGHARAAGTPTALLCTSGSAGAHYLPAVVEAALAHLPLIVITADRPNELVDCGAPQTIDQTRLFGNYARRFVDLGLPEQEELSLRALRRNIATAVEASRTPTPGPVHLNVRARKPLEPMPPVTEEELELHERVAAVAARPLLRYVGTNATATDADLRRIAEDLADEPHGIVVCGPSPAATASARGAVRELARRLGYPVFAEPTSQLRAATVSAHHHLELLYRSTTGRRSFVPRVVVGIGALPTASTFEAVLAAPSPDPWTIDVSEHGLNDPFGRARYALRGNVAANLERLATLVPERKNRDGWLDGFERAEKLIAGLVRSRTEQPGLGESVAAFDAIATAPPDSLFFAGNSMAIRLVDVFGPARDDLVMLHQRGANGIDGLIAGAAGARAATKKPVTLLLGDVSFLHDVGSLALTGGESVPLVIVVLQNRGGRIFRMLPIANGGDEGLLRHILTPHDFDFASACRAFQVGHSLVESRHDFVHALERAYAAGGTTVVEATVAPDGAERERRALAEDVERALASLF